MIDQNRLFKELISTFFVEFIDLFLLISMVGLVFDNEIYQEIGLTLK
ncbi:MAG: hypothetical protein RMY28_037065 [Nostoc sp. ChiSLP01]|nr:hypothetical protein [Nostoc sp. CmiSLP01]MDZ8287824.1 hypothetical protein [Nostoc sp. ChiSLP01]